ncbi:MAG: hypothetical protein LQ342_004249 [Letrouitia transgressa]|nr:MAG: hypothetical protein LQ342_004249 [Letrouitia transgressa]
MSGSNKRQRTQKLKDSCDQCSAAKIKCSKDKPICQRCEKLDYPCFFSPARRIGRPQPFQRARNLSTTERRSRHSSLSDRTRYGAELPDNRSPNGSESNRASSGAASVDMNTFPKDTQTNNLDHGTTAADHLLASLSFDYPSFESFHSRQQPVPDIINTSILLDPPQLPFDSSILPTESGPTKPTSNAPIATSPHSTTWSNCSTNVPATPSSPAIVDALYPNTAPSSDCSSTTLAVLSRLNEIDTSFLFSNHSPTLLENGLTAISVAVTSVFKILLCPCSNAPDTSLLVSGVCTAILDTYASMLHSTSSQGQRDSSAPAQRRGGSTHGGGNKEATTLILNELPKITKLVAQFCKQFETREGIARERSVPWTMAKVLRERVRGMIEEATRYLVQD